MTQDLFSGSQNEPDVSVETPDENVDHFSELVGEGKKFKDGNALAYGKKMSDRHVELVEKEAKDLREELQKRLTYEDLLTKVQEQMRKSQESSNEADPPNQERSNKADVNVEALVKGLLNKHKQEAVAENNVQLIHQELKNAWGPGYKQQLFLRARELDLDQSYLAKMAEENPQAFLKLILPVVKQTTDVSAPRSSVNLPNSRNSNIPKFSDYRKLLTSGNKADRAKYLSEQTQLEMAKHARDYGDDFLKR